MPTKSVPIQLDKRRNLRFDYNALCELEGQLGIPIQNIMSVGSGAGLKEMRAILWAGLVHEDSGLTIRDVGEILDKADWSQKQDAIGDSIFQALQEAFPGLKEDEKNESGSKTKK